MNVLRCYRNEKPNFFMMKNILPASRRNAVRVYNWLETNTLFVTVVHSNFTFYIVPIVIVYTCYQWDKKVQWNRSVKQPSISIFYSTQ